MSCADRVDLPDAGEGMCCYGAAARGPQGCTCWESEYDQPQSEDLQLGAMAVRPSCCDDCAFRPGSPEQLGDPRYAHSGEGGLDEVLLSAGFLCHQGMRRRLRLVHPTGAVVESDPGDYSPAQKSPMVWKADGSPADICAGWAARRALSGRSPPPPPPGADLPEPAEQPDQPSG
jgi:hypothetical protein